MSTKKSKKVFILGGDPNIVVLNDKQMLKIRGGAKEYGRVVATFPDDDGVVWETIETPSGKLVTRRKT